MQNGALPYMKKGTTFYEKGNYLFMQKGKLNNSLSIVCMCWLAMPLGVLGVLGVVQGGKRLFSPPLPPHTFLPFSPTPLKFHLQPILRQSPEDLYSRQADLCPANSVRCEITHGTVFLFLSYQVPQAKGTSVSFCKKRIAPVFPFAKKELHTQNSLPGN